MCLILALWLFSIRSFSNIHLNNLSKKCEFNFFKVVYFFFNNQLFILLNALYTWYILNPIFCECKNNFLRCFILLIFMQLFLDFTCRYWLYTIIIIISLFLSFIYSKSTYLLSFYMHSDLVLLNITYAFWDFIYCCF